MSEEKKLLIKRSGSAVEITVGGPEMATEEKPQTPSEEIDQLECPNADDSFCPRQLSKKQLCILTIAAIVTIIVAILVLIVLVGIVASHDTRLRNLETKVAVLEATNAELHYKTEQDEIRLRRQLESKIIEASNKFSLLYLQTLSLVTMSRDSDDLVALLSNRTDRLEEKVLEITELLNTSIVSEGEEQQAPPSQAPPTADTPTQCKRSVLCVRAGYKDSEVCGGDPITQKEYQAINDYNMFNRETPIHLYNKCLDNTPETTFDPPAVTFDLSRVTFDPEEGCNEVHMCMDVLDSEGTFKRLCGGPKIPITEYRRIMDTNIGQKFELKLHYACADGM